MIKRILKYFIIAILGIFLLQVGFSALLVVLVFPLYYYLLAIRITANAEQIEYYKNTTVPANFNEFMEVLSMFPYSKIVLPLLFLLSVSSAIYVFRKSKKHRLILAVLSYIFPFIALFFMFRGKGALKSVKSVKKQEVKGVRYVFKTNVENIIISNIYRHILIAGGTGSGKSKSFFVPIIKQTAEQNICGMLYDFKGELSPIMKYYHSYYKNTTKLNYFNLKNTGESVRINLLGDNITKSIHAQQAAQIIVENLSSEKNGSNGFWIDASSSLFSGIIWYIKKNHPQYSTLPHAIATIMYCDINKVIEKLFSDFETVPMVANIKQLYDNDASRTVGNILTSLQVPLSKLCNEDIFYLLSKEEVPLKLNNLKERQLLCVINNPQLSKIYSPIVSLLFQTTSRQMNQENDTESVFICDEFPTIGKIDNFLEIIETCRSNRISLVAGIQDKSKLNLVYGKEDANAIISNFGTSFWGRNTNAETNRLVSEMFGKTDRVFINKSKGKSGEIVPFIGRNKGTSTSVQERDILKSSEMVNYTAGQFSGFVIGTPSRVVSQQFIEEDYSTEKGVNYKQNISLQSNYQKIIKEVQMMFAI